MNVLKTTFLMALLTVILVTVGGALGGEAGLIMAFLFSLAMNGASYWFSDKIVLRMYGAKEIGADDAPALHRIVQELSLRAKMPMPRLYRIPQDAPNAFATGRDENHAAVAVTDGILRILNEAELRGVLVHELSHIKNRDILVGTIAAALAGAISIDGRRSHDIVQHSSSSGGAHPAVGEYGKKPGMSAGHSILLPASPHIIFTDRRSLRRLSGFYRDQASLRRGHTRLTRGSPVG